MDPNEAITRLREELEKLGEKSRLKDVDVSLENTPKRWLRNDIRVLNATMRGQGSFEDVVGFIYELHREPFSVRVKSLTLEQLQRPTSRNEKTVKQGQLKMTVYLDTLILPPCELVAQITPAVLEAANRQPMSRPAEASLVGYKPLLDRKLFQPYVAPAIVGPRPPRPGPTNVAQPSPKTTVQPPPPPPADAAKVLGRVLSSPRGQLAVLEDKARRGEDEYKEIGDAMYGGTLIYIDPRGAVTERDGQWRFHEVGEPLQNGKPLTEQDQPLVYHELLKLEQRATGISARPQ